MTVTTPLPTPGSLGITGRQEWLVYAALRAGESMTLREIQSYLHDAGVEAQETTISARIRDINRRLHPFGLRVRHHPMDEETKLMLYRLEG